MLDVREAAEYCGIVPKRFPAECGVTPVSMPSGERRYDMRDLDAWLDRLKGGDGSSDDELIGKLG
ncbi:MAG: helix-turn-helix domain-containing protein [Mesorhizobium sp.]|nr:MAG: helix-turn-helix domain-containing protein [Mesorhizobium sp.]